MWMRKLAAATAFDQSFGTTATVDGVTLTVGATGGAVVSRNNGLGVSGRPEGRRLGLGETLSFNFSEDVLSVTASIFENGSEDEDFAFTSLDGTVNSVILGGTNGVSLTNFSQVFSAATNTFSFSGLEANAPGNRGIKIRSITVETSEPANVPLPAGGLMLGTGLLGLGIARKRFSLN